MKAKHIFFKETMNRSIRRHHYERLKNKRKYYWAVLDNIPLDGAALGICIDTPQICSLPCCGNPRRHFGEKTRKEKYLKEDSLFLTQCKIE